MDALGSLGAELNRSIATASPRTPYTGSRHAAADMDSELSRMQKQNFNLKLRIYYLEERLAKTVGADGGDASVSVLHEEIFEQKMVIEEKTRELEERNVLLVKARNAIETLQADVELARAEADRLRSFEESERQSAAEVDELVSQVRSLESQLAAARDPEEVDAQLQTKDAIIRQLEGDLDRAKADATVSLEKEQELRSLRQEVVRLSSELGEARGRSEALAKQGQEVAQLEANEIASLQATIATLRQEMETERSLSAELAKELELKTNLLGEADSTIKDLEDKLELAERGGSNAEQSLQASTSAWERERAEMALQIQTMKNRELESDRILAEQKGTMLSLEAACKATEARCEKLRDELDEARMEVRALNQRGDLQAAEQHIHVEQERTKTAAVQEELEAVKKEARQREIELQQKLRHWEHHLRSTLVDFLPDRSLAAKPDSRRGSQASSVFYEDASGRQEPDKEAELELVSMLQSLPRIRSWFESACKGYEAQAEAKVEELQRCCETLSAKLAEVEGQLRPTIAAASAAISAGQAAEQRAATALVQRGGFEQERNSLKQAVDDRDRDIARLKAELDAANERLERLSQNNRAILLDLEEKRTVADMALREQSTLLADAERLRSQVLERDAQLDHYMTQLATQLSGISGTSKLSSEQVSSLSLRLQALISEAGGLVAESSGALRLLTSTAPTLQDMPGIMSSLSELLRQNETLSNRLQHTAMQFHGVLGSSGPPPALTQAPAKPPPLPPSKPYGSGAGMSGVIPASAFLARTAGTSMAFPGSSRFGTLGMAAAPSFSSYSHVSAGMGPPTVPSAASLTGSSFPLGASFATPSQIPVHTTGFSSTIPAFAGASVPASIAPGLTFGGTGRQPVFAAGVERYGQTARSTLGFSGTSSGVGGGGAAGGIAGVGGPTSGPHFAKAAPGVVLQSQPGATPGMSPATDKQFRLEQVQRDMASRLGRIGDELRATSSRIQGHSRSSYGGQ